MYHYVRDLGRSRYPNIKGRDIKDFCGQLEHLARKYTLVTAEQVVAAVKGGTELPPKACWLTFDDGYLDHWLVVFPLLHERGWQGTFFPPAQAIREGTLLDVNRIHFIIASQPDPATIIEAIRRFVSDRSGQDEIETFEHYWHAYAEESSLDSTEIVFIKQMLQFGLPDAPRKELANDLFRDYVSIDPAAFAAELYMSMDQLRTMIRCGMYVGNHGNEHLWLDTLDPADQQHEIDQSLAFLKELGAPTSEWVMCYPYGAYDKSLLDILSSSGCMIGVTTKCAIADLSRGSALELPRLDTNDLPVD
jgi:peptidoglycan/xylan/chitin deacetylase (PgdA/CDA1 family)